MTSTTDIPVDVLVNDHKTFQQVLKTTKGGDSSSTGSSYESTADESSITSASSQVSDEVPMQVKLMENARKIEFLTSQIHEVDKKIGSLTLQLNRATSSESALAIAVNDIEEQRLALEEYFMEKRKKWKNLPHKEQERRASVERDFLNEIMAVTKQMEQMNRNHNQLMRAKDKEIKALKQKLKQWDKLSGSGDQVFYSN